jgi:hypothetical protein
MVVTIGFSHHESEGDGFVNKGSFPEIALVINRFPARVDSFPGRASPARGNASARSALGCAHGWKWKSPANEKARREACAKLDLYF